MSTFLLTFTLLAALVDLEVSGKLVCQKEWLMKRGSCYRWGPSKMPFHQAKAHCAGWGSELRVITDGKENELFRDRTGKGELYWLGIQKRVFDWKIVKNGKEENIRYTPRGTSLSTFDHFGEKRDCLVWESSYLTWKTESCDSTIHPFVCQKGPASQCPIGRFGTNCEQKCTCKGQAACDPYTGACPKGCQLGWSGPFCSKEKKKAEAKFYCFKVKTENMLLLRINQRGTRYRTVTAYNKDGTESPGCNKTHFNYFEPAGMATLKVIQKEGIFAPSCGEDKKNDVVTWRFKFQEFPKMSSVADVLFEVTCDFKKAESLTRLEASTIEIPPPRRVKVEESKALVNFHIVDPYTEEKLTKVKLGQEVKLQLKLNHNDEDAIGVSGILPYNCSVSSSDGIQHMEFKDEYGCTPNGSRILLTTVGSNAVHSATFEAFTFPGQAKVSFRCSYRVCFSEETDCKGICHPRKIIRRKKSRHVKDSHAKNRHVKDSHAKNRHVKDSHAKNRHVKDSRVERKEEFRVKKEDALGLVGSHLGFFG